MLRVKLGAVVGIGVLTFVLTGCQVVEDFKEGFKEGYERGAAETTVEVTPMEKEEYEVAVSGKTQEFVGRLAQTLNDMNGAKVIDKQMKDKWYDEIDSMELLTKEVVAMEPSESYAEVDEVYEQSMEEFQVYLGFMRDALDKEDLKIIVSGAEHLEMGELLWNRANALLSLTYDRPMGDGTITTADLKSLDKNAGIDRDSVLLNVSEGGPELVGKWGRYQEDGSFQMGIELNEDGSYKGYANGESTPGIEGVWSYDYLRETLSFEHEEGLRTMTMDLQAFHEDTLQMMDVDTLNTFRYVKEGTENPDTAASEEESVSAEERAENGRPDELKHLWSIVTDQDVYHGLGLQEEEFASYSISDYKSGSTMNYMGSWKYDAEKNIIEIDVEEALKDYKEVKDFPKTLQFKLVEVKGDTLVLEIDGEVLDLKNH